MRLKEWKHIRNVITSYSIHYTKLYETENLDNRIKESWKGKVLTKLTKAKETEDAIAELRGKMKQAKQDQQKIRALEIEEEETDRNNFV